MSKPNYKSFDPVNVAELAINYLTGMTDEANDYLPYWLVLPHKKPAEAAHCKVDDAELVASWFEGISCAREVAGTEAGAEQQAAFRRHLMQSWGEHGLRYHKKYPWTQTLHASFHEMGYVLSALNRCLVLNPDDTEAEEHAANLVKGMLGLAIQRKTRVFWSGDSKEPQTVYEFPNDIYLQDGGFDMSYHTGRGEQSIRNGVIVYPLIKRYELTGDENALELARGYVNYLLGHSRYFSYNMEFFGHVHSSLWVASGMIMMGRLTNEPFYVKKGKEIYDFVRTKTSSFGWVPEFMKWKPMLEENCETCCIKDLLECAHELVLSGYEEYWTDINSFVRNQLVENQVTPTGYVVTDDNREDDRVAGITYKRLNKRMIGGFSGGSQPNSMSLTKFRSIAGCCAGFAPVGLWRAWTVSIGETENRVTVNIPLNKDVQKARVRSFYPNEGRIEVTVMADTEVAFRTYAWMGAAEDIKVTVNGEAAEAVKEGALLVVSAKAGDVVALEHALETVIIPEEVRGAEYRIVWRGPDVVDILPHGEHMRLYQRNLDIPYDEPTPEEVEFTGASDYGPTQQKR
ncbi:MAG: hypothetical protein J6J86_07315 [Lachnospiraceae bacterium]|nr:hypothetical protein [Lachnospiraceae bacterium]